MALSLPPIAAGVADASPCVLPPPAIQSAFLPPKPSIPLKTTRFRSNSRWPTPIFATRGSVSSATIPSPSGSPSSSAFSRPTGWIVVMASPAIRGLSNKAEIIDYYISTLARVLGSEKKAQKSIYDASWETHFEFCCDIDEEASDQLANIPGVLSVRPDEHPESTDKDYSYSNPIVEGPSKSGRHSSKVSVSVPGGSSKYWLVRMEKPGVEVVTKAQIVDYYAQTLTKVLRNEKDSQVSMYHISWEKYYGFCCQIDEECAQELTGVPGVLSVHPDLNYDSNNKDYRGSHIEPIVPCTTNQLPNRTKRLFVTGLSFYTSEKTLRAAFEGFGELVEVKVIMDKISKRSKGYAFIEYTTEEAAEAALREMNGKIINGWMIVVDIAKTNPPKYSKGRQRSSNWLTSST